MSKTNISDLILSKTTNPESPNSSSVHLKTRQALLLYDLCLTYRYAQNQKCLQVWFQIFLVADTIAYLVKNVNKFQSSTRVCELVIFAFLVVTSHYYIIRIELTLKDSDY